MNELEFLDSKVSGLRSWESFEVEQSIMKLVPMGEHRRSKNQAKKQAEGNSVILEFFMKIRRGERSYARESIFTSSPRQDSFFAMATSVKFCFLQNAQFYFRNV